MSPHHRVGASLIFVALLGVSAVGFTPSPGVWTGTTDQSRTYGMTVDPAGLTVTQLSLDVKITNPAGCSVTIASHPTGTFPISGNAFSYDSGPTTCGTRLEVSGTFTSATTASGTLTATSVTTSCPPSPPPCPGTVTTAWTATGPAPEPTRVIALSGSLAFGLVTVGTTSTRTLTISNSGNSTLTVSWITYPDGFSGGWSGTVAAGGSRDVTVTFAPTAAQEYGGTVTVASDKTSGTDTIVASGTGSSVGPVEPTQGIITTVAGSGTSGFSGDGGPATAARMRQTWDVAVDGAGNLYIGDVGNYCVWKVTAATGIITVVAGNGTSGATGDDGAATQAQLNYPAGVALDAAGNIYIADRNNRRVRKVTAATGIITTFAGDGSFGSGGDGGPAILAQLREPFGVTLDGSGNVYIADFSGDSVRKVEASTGIITTIAGTGLNSPSGLAVDGEGNVYVADRNNHCVRRVAAGTGSVTTIAGTGTSGFNGDGLAATAAQLYYPVKVALDTAGNVYIGDSYNHRIRKVAASSGIITTVAGTGMSGFSGDGAAATEAQLNVPHGVALDSAGNLFIADGNNYRIRKVTAARRGGPDFDGDGKADVLWRHATGGDLWLWPMDGTARTAETYVRTVSDTSWEVRAIADFDGNGKADLLWRNSVSGQVYYWPMDGATPLAETYVATVDPAYDIAGAGDFDGDGKSDLLWRHTTLGDAWVWLMAGATPLAEVYVDRVDPGYVVKGVGDLDGNGKADIVWHHATLGEVWVWPMNGTTRVDQVWVGTVPDTGYQIQGVADFTGDGKADLVWWHATRGEVWIWTMNGAERAAETWAGTVPDTNYRIAATGDYNGDTKADLLWRNVANGEVWIWLMDGTTRVSETWVATVPDTGYHIVK